MHSKPLCQHGGLQEKWTTTRLRLCGRICWASMSRYLKILSILSVLDLVTVQVINTAQKENSLKDKL